MVKAFLIVSLVLVVTWSIHLNATQRLGGSVRDLAMEYYHTHQDTIRNRRYLTVIDFTKPSYAKRMFLLDLETGSIRRYLVAHGEKSGFIYPTQMSNEIGSHKSCRGFFLTGESYRGDYGPALKLQGLEAGVNDNAFRRDIVLHGASWVSYGAVLENGGRLGRSWGCPAVPSPAAAQIVERLKGGSLVYIHADH
jgi:hypothetical protein